MHTDWLTLRLAAELFHIDVGKVDAKAVAKVQLLIRMLDPDDAYERDTKTERDAQNLNMLEIIADLTVSDRRLLWDLQLASVGGTRHLFMNLNPAILAPPSEKLKEAVVRLGKKSTPLSRDIFNRFPRWLYLVRSEPYRWARQNPTLVARSSSLDFMERAVARDVALMGLSDLTKFLEEFPYWSCAFDGAPR